VSQCLVITRPGKLTGKGDFPSLTLSLTHSLISTHSHISYPLLTLLTNPLSHPLTHPLTHSLTLPTHCLPYPHCPTSCMKGNEVGVSPPAGAGRWRGLRGQGMLCSILYCTLLYTTVLPYTSLYRPVQSSPVLHSLSLSCRLFGAESNHNLN
jgi:hypothetical protein